MIKHVVIWKLKNFNDGEMLKRELEDLAGKISGLISIEVGIDINRSEAAGDLILISTHENKESLDIYQNHPLHIQVRDKIVLHVTSRTVVDYVI